jgi:hypothetical protein
MLVFLVSTTVTALISWAVGFSLPEHPEGGPTVSGSPPTSNVSTTLIIGTSTSTTKTTAEIPIRVSVENDPVMVDAFADDGMAMILPIAAAAGQVPRLPPKPPGAGCIGLHDWARRVKGVDQGITRVRLVVQGDSNKAVVITGISARVVAVRPIPASVSVFCGPEGEAQIRNLTVDLDAPNPAAVYTVAGRKSPFGFTLRKGETEIFDVRASTRRRQIIEWNLVLRLVVAGEPREIEVQDRGAPFRTSDGRPRRALEWPREWTDPAGSWRSPL